MSDAAIAASPEIRVALNGLIVRRLRLWLFFGLATIAAFTVANHIGARPTPLWADVVNIALLALIGATFVLLALPVVQQRPIPLGLLIIGVACSVRAAAGIQYGDLAPTAIVMNGVAVLAAATLPWGAGAQIIVALFAGGAAAVNAYFVPGGFGTLSGQAIAAFSIGLVLSVVLSVELRRHQVRLITDNWHRRKAEEHLARLNAVLEQRVMERTSELATAKQRLEYEAEELTQVTHDMRESQRRLHDVLDHAKAAIYLRDLAGRYLLVNRHWTELAQLPMETIIGRTIDEIMPPDVATAFRAHGDEAVKSGESRQFEETVPLPDGPRTFVSVRFPSFGEDGRPIGVWGISTDITAHKQTEAELQRSEAALLTLIEHTTDAIWSVDRDLNVTVMNGVARQRFKERFGRAFDNSERAQLTGPRVDELRELYALAFAGERAQVERSYEGPDGTEYYLTSVHPIIENGTVIGATGFSKNITEHKRAEAQARERQAELAHVLRLGTMGEMAAGLAHEINQPLGAIANYAQGCIRRLRSGTSAGADVLPALEEIAAEALRAGEIIRRLRDLVRKEPLQQEPADLNHLVRESARVVEAEARQLGVRLQLDLAPDLPAVPCSDVQIEQVLLNLLLNGVEAVQNAAGDERVVAVSTATVNGNVEVAIRDNGIGIPEPSTVVFAPFYTTKPNGLGMGLSISRSIIEAHGGRLWAVRNADRGSTFRFSLPA